MSKERQIKFLQDNAQTPNTMLRMKLQLFEMSNGRNHSIMDEDFRLISADAIDAACKK